MALEDPLLLPSSSRTSKFDTMFLMFMFVILTASLAYEFLFTIGFFFEALLKVGDENSGVPHLLESATFVLAAILAATSFTLMLCAFVVSLAKFVLLVGKVIAWIYHALITGKKLVVSVGDSEGTNEEDVTVEDPIAIPLFFGIYGGDFAVSLLAFMTSIMGWNGTVYMVKGVSKLPDFSYDDMKYATVYGFEFIVSGLVSLFIDRWRRSYFNLSTILKHASDIETGRRHNMEEVK